MTLALSKITEEMGPVPCASEPYTRVTEEAEVALPLLVRTLVAAPAAFAAWVGLPPCRVPLTLPLALSPLLVLPPNVDDAEAAAAVTLTVTSAGTAVAAVKGFDPSFDGGGPAPGGRGPTSKRRTGPSLVPRATMQPQTSRHVGDSGTGISTFSVSATGGDWWPCSGVHAAWRENASEGSQHPVCFS